jgi:hypothetical protein
MAKQTRKIKRNIAENKFGVRACTERGILKKLRKLEAEVAAKTKTSLSGGDVEGDKDTKEGG